VLLNGVLCCLVDCIVLVWIFNACDFFEYLICDFCDNLFYSNFRLHFEELARDERGFLAYRAHFGLITVLFLLINQHCPCQINKQINE